MYVKMNIFAKILCYQDFFHIRPCWSPCVTNEHSIKYKPLFHCTFTLCPFIEELENKMCSTFIQLTQVLWQCRM